MLSGTAQQVWNDLPVLIAVLPCVYVLLNSVSGVWACQGIFQDQPQFFFDATIDFSYQMASSQDTKAKENQQPFPKLVVKLISKSGLKTKVEGYGVVHIPIYDLGTYDVTAHLWRPTGEINSNKYHGFIEKIGEYYIGGAYHLLKEDIFPEWKSSSAVTDISSTRLRFESRFGMRSESSGASIQIRVTNYSLVCVEKNSDMLLKTAATRQSKNGLEKSESPVDELVARLRRNRWERKLRKQSISGENQELLQSYETLTTSARSTALMHDNNDELVCNIAPYSTDTTPLVGESVDTERTTAVLRKIQLKKIERSKSLLNENLHQFFNKNI